MPAVYYLVWSVLLFVIGGVGALVRRNMIMVLLGLQLQFAGVAVAFVALSRAWSIPKGEAWAVVMLIVAAAQLAVGLAVALIQYKHFRSTDLDTCHSVEA